ncbi:MAG: MmcQ/YjbR family DNA-binding protein [Saprospirales bacterium]|nr:MAG: MmcQ/YjbR family DNA-binding protein [Saprospirales bacterium]
MDIVSFRDYVIEKKGVTEDLPFDESILAFRIGNKIFALTNLDAAEFSINLKGNPQDNITNREKYPEAVFPGYHMNKQHWNTVFPNKNLPAELFFQMVDQSFNLVYQSLPKKVRESLQK